MKKNSIYILPNDQIIQDCFHYEYTEEYLEVFETFCEKNHLDYDFRFKEAPLVLVKNGHLVIQTNIEASSAVFYIPDEVCDKQAKWIHDNMDLFSKFTSLSGYEIYNNKVLHGTDEVVKKIDYYNMFYEKRKGDNNVRQKI